MKSEFETWPATPVEASLKSAEVLSALEPGRSCFFFNKTEQPGSADHPTNIADWRLQIAD